MYQLLIIIFTYFPFDQWVVKEPWPIIGGTFIIPISNVNIMVG